MSFSKEQYENWFSYHAPTEETAPKYEAIRNAEQDTIVNVTQTSYEVGPDTAQLHQEINRSTRRFAEAIDANCPDSVDKTAAIQCVRLARNLFNEWVVQRDLPKESQSWVDVSILFAQAEQELLRARFRANSAIACGGK